MADTAVEATPGDENDDSWLYGESAGDQTADKEDDGNQQQSTDAADGAAVSLAITYLIFGYNIILRS